LASLQIPQPIAIDISDFYCFVEKVFQQ
jgi:hypothetical protein